MLALNMEQALTEDLGAFLRLSWNDGRTKNWMFTEMDRAISFGLSLDGAALGTAGGHGGARHQYRLHLEGPAGLPGGRRHRLHRRRRPAELRAGMGDGDSTTTRG